MDEDDNVIMEMSRVGREKAGSKRGYSMNEDGTLYMEQHFHNTEGIETWSMAYDMEKM